MKTKLMALALFSIFNFQLSIFNSQFSTIATAQAQRPSREEMQARRAEMVERQAEKLAKDFDLKGDAKTDFIATYKEYQQALQASQAQERQRPERNGERAEGQKEKKLTAEQATQQIDEYFARQEQQIKRQQARLEVDKKYYAILKEKLTPQQLVKIFSQQRNQRQGGGQQRGGFGPQGGQGPRGGGFGGGPEGGFGGDF